MVKISILYPNNEGVRFDFDYYLNVHMPQSIGILSRSPGFRSVSVEQGVSGGYPDTAPRYIAMCHFEFDTFDAFLEAFMPHAEALQGDMPNYTDVEPVIQVNEIRLTG